MSLLLKTAHLPNDTDLTVACKHIVYDSRIIIIIIVIMCFFCAISPLEHKAQSMKQNRWKNKKKKKNLTLCDRPPVFSLFLSLSLSFTPSPPKKISRSAEKKFLVMIWRMKWCWMTWFRKEECSRLPTKHKKMTFDQASACVQWEYREWKYQISKAGVLAYRFSGGQSTSQELSIWGNYNREKIVCTVSVNQWVTNEAKQDQEKCGPF